MTVRNVVVCDVCKREFRAPSDIDPTYQIQIEHQMIGDVCRTCAEHGISIFKIATGWHLRRAS